MILRDRSEDRQNLNTHLWSEWMIEEVLKTVLKRRQTADLAPGKAQAVT